jgi:hypothetical protein
MNTGNVKKLLNEKATGLRLVRRGKDQFIDYSEIQFSRGLVGLEHMLKMSAIHGDIGDPGENLGDVWLDILDADGDILQEIPIGKRSFAYIKRKTKSIRVS